MRKVSFVITYEFDQDGLIDHDALEANLNRLLQYGVSEGVITPNEEDHATLVGHDVTPGGRS